MNVRHSDSTTVNVFDILVPGLCLGTDCLVGSADLVRGGASHTVGYEAEPRNQFV